MASKARIGFVRSGSLLKGFPLPLRVLFGWQYVTDPPSKCVLVGVGVVADRRNPVVELHDRVFGEQWRARNLGALSRSCGRS